MVGFGFLGTYDATLDDKGRVRLPSKFRPLLEDGFVITYGTENCLSVYPKETWLSLTRDVTNFPKYDMDAIEFRRTLFPTAIEGSFDASGRVLIPIKHRSYANLEKELVVTGNYDFFEIWDKDAWEAKDYHTMETRKELQTKLDQKQTRKGNS